MAEQPGAVQMFRLQVVDAENNVVARFAAGGDVEVDLIEACTREIRRTWIPPDDAFAKHLDEHVRGFFGLTTRQHAARVAVAELSDWRERGGNPTDIAISSSIARVILALKQHMVTILKERCAIRL